MVIVGGMVKGLSRASKQGDGGRKTHQPSYTGVQGGGKNGVEGGKGWGKAERRVLGGEVVSEGQMRQDEGLGEGGESKGYRAWRKP